MKPKFTTAVIARRGLSLACALGSIALGLIWTATSLSQGVITFNNRVAGVLEEPVYDVGGVVRLAGPAFLAQLYAAPAGAAEADLVARGTPTPFRTGAAAGYVVNAGVVAIAGVNPLERAQIQVRAWEAAAGNTYEAALGAGGRTGKSESFLSDRLEPINTLRTPTYLIGLRSFSLVPEPSGLVLGVIGLCVGLARARQRRSRAFSGMMKRGGVDG